MNEKRFYLDEEDRLCIHYDDRIVACVGCRETEAEKIVDLLNEQQATINELKAKLKEKEEDEQLYANEILELREANKEFIQFKELGGDY